MAVDGGEEVGETPAGAPEATAAAPSGRAARVLLHPSFGPYFVGNLLSNCGTWFQNIAQALLIFRLTHSALLVGVVNFAQFVGIFVLAPWSGSAADRFNRRRLLVVTQLGAVAVTASLAVLTRAHHATAPVVIALALVLGLTTAFAIPALQALVPLLVDTRDLGAAIAFNSVTFTLARAIGPVLGALVVARWGIATAFALNSLSYLALIGALAVVRPHPQAPRPASRPRLRDSIAIVRADARLAWLLGVIAAISITQDPVNTLTPFFATRVYHHSDVLTGWLVGAFGLGSALAGVTIAGRTGDRSRRIPWTCGLLGAAMAGFAVSGTMAVGLVTLFLGGVGFLASNTTATTMVQLEVDDAQRGRMMALWSVSFLGTRPFASLADGALAGWLGLRAAGIAMAVPALVVAVGLTRFHRRTTVSH